VEGSGYCNSKYWFIVVDGEEETTYTHEKLYYNDRLKKIKKNHPLRSPPNTDTPFSTDERRAAIIQSEKTTKRQKKKGKKVRTTKRKKEARQFVNTERLYSVWCTAKRSSQRK
jgi:hypothetical protein